MIGGTKYLGLFNIARSIQHNLKIYRTKSTISNKSMDTDIVWIDLEMTGLDIDKDKIIEVACLITNANLQIQSPEFHAIIHQSDESLDNMNDWCKKTHGDSGLTDAVKNSKTTMADAETQLLSFITKYIKKARTSPMAGNSIYMDRLFIRKQMPSVDEYLHYRVIDVSSIKELAKRWYPHVVENLPDKFCNHRAIDDIKESINELNFYRQHMFKK